MATKKTQSKDVLSQALVRAEQPAVPVKLGGLGHWMEVKKVSDDPHFVQASDALKMVKGLIETVEVERKALTQPLLQVKNKLDANAKVIRAPAEELERHIKGLLVAYEDKKRQEAIKLAEKQAAKVEKSSPQVAAETREQAAVALSTPEVGGLSFRRLKSARVTDFMALVKAVAAGKASIECLMPNERFLDAMAKASQGDCPFPGCVWYEETIAASRAS